MDICSRLPTEVQDMVLHRLRSSKDLKSLRLVDWHLNRVATPFLWETLSIIFCDFRNRDIEDLLDSDVPRHVKYLTVRACQHDNHNGWPTGFEANVMRLLCALPRDALRVFDCTDGLDVIALEMLLKLQTGLRELVYKTKDVGAYRRVPRPAWIRDSFKHVRRLGVFLKRNDGVDFGAWLKHMPALEVLEVNGTLHRVGPVETRVFQLLGWPLPPPAIVLQSLRLNHMRLPNDVRSLYDTFAFSQLKTLEIEACTHSVGLLQHLVQEFLQVATKPALKRFVYADQQDQGTIRHVEDFLSSFSGLGTLYVDCAKALPLHRACIVAHGAFPETVILNTHSMWTNATLIDPYYYSSAALLRIARACPNIKELGIHISPINLGTWPALQPHRLLHNTKFAERLRAIAHFTKLHTLRLTTAPKISNPHRQSIPVHSMQAMCQQAATEIMSFLANHGSPVKVLAFSPVRINMAEMPNIAEIKGTLDGNGHGWPHYYYQRGEVKLPSSIVKTIAMPWSKKAMVEEQGTISEMEMLMFLLAKHKVVWGIMLGRLNCVISLAASSDLA
ncbi:hypothetical protein BDV95DRAFT_250453 [Massariosphaeria phaeospora]|uniref:F-box domain-containing protein n=1 Tax=Massariosphaeria phaeospora TaxID=100035 RepID=A0A7C8M1U4_9PLEO|nr:hypothetical protein BDV95DRAFT_250453 [Massariosphaeria phaeospora]